MFRRILIAMDGSIASEHLFEQSLPFIKTMNAQVLLFHVLPNRLTHASNLNRLANWHHSPPLTPEVEEPSHPTQLQFMRAQDDLATTEGLESEIRIATGEPGQEICRMACTWQADLILMGHRGFSGLTTASLPSISAYVLLHAPCPVLVIQHTVASCNLPFNVAHGLQ